MKAQTAQAYATLNVQDKDFPGQKTLTFYYGNNKPAEADGLKVYDVDPDNFTNAWIAEAPNIWHVKFDASFAQVKMKSCANMFQGCAHLWDVNGLKNFNTENVTDMSGMFSGCTNLLTLDLSKFNTSNVKDMSAMFGHCEKLKTLDLSSFSTSNLENTINMFDGCENLTTIYASKLFVTDNIKDSTPMFSGNNKLVGAVAYSNENKNDATLANYKTGYFTQKPEAYAVLEQETGYVGKVLTFYYGPKPESASGVYDVDPENFKQTWSADADKIEAVRFDESFAQVKMKSCNGMFEGCVKIESINGMANLNTESVTDMSGMFFHCRNLQTIDLSGFNTENVTSMSNMFTLCVGLQKLDFSSFNTSKVTDMSNMFANCSSLQTLDLTSFNTPALQKTENMFVGCSTLETIYANDNFITTNITSSNQMFYGNDKLVGAAKYSEDGTKDKSYANYKTGYFSYYYTIGGEKHPIAGDPLKTDGLVLVDGKDFETSKMFDAENATYSRNVSHKWSTLCLPYEFDAKDNATAYFYEIKNLTDDVLYVTRIDGTVKAGVPVIAYRKANNDKIVVNATKAEIYNEPYTETMYDYNLVGSFVEQTVPANAYIIGNDCFWLSSELTAADKGGATAVKTKGFRAYILPKGSNAAGSRVMIGFSDNVTAVDALNKAEEGITECYDVMGRRLSAPQKGINIIKIGNKTKKVIIK